jgi:hypothetical protein
VSIEQPGLGIWLYFLGGKVLASVIVNSSAKPVDTNEHKIETRISASSIVLVCSIIATTTSLYFVSHRFVNDVLLRSSIQNAMEDNSSEADLKNIESLTIQLRAEPEYAVQSVPILAKFGDGPALLNISKLFYDYNPQSIQAIGIRAQVLKVVTSAESACELQEKLLLNTPWQQEIVENYLECLKLGNRNKDYRNQLTLVKKYVNFFPAINDTPVTLESMLARAVGARVEFELGNFDLANSLKIEIEKQMQDFGSSNPGRDFSKIVLILDY